MRVTQTTCIMIAAALGAIALSKPLALRPEPESIVACREVRELGQLIAQPMHPPRGCRAIPAEEVCHRYVGLDGVARVMTCDGEALWVSAP